MIRTKVNSRGSLLDVSDPAELLIATKPKYSKIKYSSTDRNLELKLSEDLAFLSTHNVLITGIPVQSVIPVYIHCCQWTILLSFVSRLYYVHNCSFVDKNKGDTDLHLAPSIWLLYTSMRQPFTTTQHTHCLIALFVVTSVLIGLNDKATEGLYRWKDGSTLGATGTNLFNKKAFQLTGGPVPSRNPPFMTPQGQNHPRPCEENDGQA